jgi:hypothetical protein
MNALPHSDNEKNKQKAQSHTDTGYQRKKKQTTQNKTKIRNKMKTM